MSCDAHYGRPCVVPVAGCDGQCVWRWGEFESDRMVGEPESGVMYVFICAAG